jgi:hypothetical protein
MKTADDIMSLLGLLKRPIYGCANGGARVLAGGEKSGQRCVQQGLFAYALKHFALVPNVP